MNNIIETAEAWTAKVNERDAAGVLALSDHNIELSGPRGTATGHSILADWLENSGIHLMTTAHFVKGGKIICEQQGTWENEAGSVTIYTFMEIKDGKVLRIERLDSLDDAFGTSGLSESDKIN